MKCIDVCVCDLECQVYFVEEVEWKCIDLQVCECVCVIVDMFSVYIDKLNVQVEKVEVVGCIKDVDKVCELIKIYQIWFDEVQKVFDEFSV